MAHRVILIEVLQTLAERLPDGGFFQTVFRCDRRKIEAVFAPLHPQARSPQGIFDKSLRKTGPIDLPRDLEKHMVDALQAGLCGVQVHAHEAVRFGCGVQFGGRLRQALLHARQEFDRSAARENIVGQIFTVCNFHPLIHSAPAFLKLIP